MSKSVSDPDLAALGVGGDSTVAEIKRAYRLKVKQCHPDLNPGDADAEARMVALQQAYERVLAHRENPDRVARLFGQQGRDLTFAPTPASWAPMDTWARESMVDKVNQWAQTAIMLLLLSAPVAVAALGGLLLSPVVEERIAEHSSLVRRAVAHSRRESQPPIIAIVRTSDDHVLVVRAPRSSQAD